MSTQNREPRRVLVLRPRALGDVLLATPALRALKSAWPACALDVAVDDVLEPLLRRNPHVDRLWLLPRRKPRRLGDWARVYAGIARAGYDLAIDLHGSPRTAMLAWLSGAPRRVGYALRGRGALYTLRVPRDSDRHGRRRALYAARTNLEIVARCGVRGDALDDVRLVLPPDPAVEAAVAAWFEPLVPAAPRIGLVPFATWQAKTYPISGWIEIGTRLVRAGCSVVLLWGPGELDVAAAVQRGMQDAATLLPPTDIDAAAAVVARLDLLVCHDSGIKHVAVARGTPTLTLFGPTRPEAWTPPDGPHAGLRVELPCTGCNRTGCSHHLCMRGLDAGAVAARALELVGRKDADPCAS
jgi:lipopolysaccharide heptosyltransferase II